MNARLSTVAPDLVQALVDRSPTILRAVAVDVCEWVVVQAGLENRTVEASLGLLRDQQFGESTERDALAQLIETLDEHAWDLQDLVNNGGATQRDYLEAFARARAASAVWCAMDLDPLEAALESSYEAQAAKGDLQGLRQVVATRLD